MARMTVGLAGPYRGKRRERASCATAMGRRQCEQRGRSAANLAMPRSTRRSTTRPPIRRSGPGGDHQEAFGGRARRLHDRDGLEGLAREGRWRPGGGDLRAAEGRRDLPAPAHDHGCGSDGRGHPVVGHRRPVPLQERQAGCEIRRPRRSVMRSGQVDRRGRISKNGSRALRTALVEVAHTLGRFDTGALGRYYAQKVVVKDKTKTAVALARKLLVVAWKMMLKGQDYRAAKRSRVQVKGREVAKTAARVPDWDGCFRICRRSSPASVVGRCGRPAKAGWSAGANRQGKASRPGGCKPMARVAASCTTAPAAVKMTMVDAWGVERPRELLHRKTMSRPFQRGPSITAALPGRSWVHSTLPDHVMASTDVGLKKPAHRPARSSVKTNSCDESTTGGKPGFASPATDFGRRRATGVGAGPPGI